MLRRLFSRLKPQRAPLAPLRDTDRDWAIIGETEPYFGVLTSERFKRHSLDDAARAEFFQSGESQIQKSLHRMQALFGPFTPGSALDFGCGVGRLTMPLAALTGAATGVDISPGMLAEARKHSQPGLRFVDTLPDETFDWIMSLIVFQHIPPERGYPLLDALLSRVAAGGGATIEIMFARTQPHENSAGARLIIGDTVRPAVSRVNLADIPDGEMIMHDYDLSIVTGLFFKHGLHYLGLDHCDHGGVIGATIHARKPV